MTNSSSSELLPTPAAPFQTRLLIDNCWIESESGEILATINPSNGETICEVAAAGVADVGKEV
jgi:aldehyde dehydrogenase (NAD+)